jgi:hypothetical protein
VDNIIVETIQDTKVVYLQRGTDDYQGNVILGGLSEPVRISLSTMGFSSFFTIFETLEEALEHLHSQIES